MAVISIKTWDELLATATDNKSEYSWEGGDLDFNEINPSGYDETISLAGGIDFHDAVFRNFHSRASTAFSFSINTGLYLKNWHMENVYFTPKGTTSYFIKTTRAFDKIENCTFVIETYPIISGTANNYNQYMLLIFSSTTIIDCGFNLKYDYTQPIKVLACSNSAVYIYNSKIILDVSQSGSVLTDQYLVNCKIIGKFDNKEGTPVQIGGKYSAHNTILLEGDSGFTYPGAGKSVYNSELTTITGDNIIACDSTQIHDAAFMRSNGFPIGVN